MTIMKIPVCGQLLFLSKNEAIAGIARLERDGFTVVRCGHVYDPCSSETVYCGISINVAKIPTSQEMHLLWEKIRILAGPDGDLVELGAGPCDLRTIWDEPPPKKPREQML
jgi:hypothetical protein